MPSSPNPFADDNAYDPPLAESVEPGAGANDAALGWLVPIGQSVFAVVAGYLGLLSLGCCPLGPFAILFGVLAIVDIKKHPDRHGLPRAIVGILLGLVSSAGLVFLLIGLAMDAVEG